MIEEKYLEKYLELIERVAKIDINAATYMLSEAPKLCTFIISDTLTGAFVFSDTPQGSVYWRAVVRALNTKQGGNQMTEEKYLELIERVAKIDVNAAKYMISEAPNLRSFISDTTSLLTAFVFSDTPQGFEYWMHIAKKLNK